MPRVTTPTDPEFTFDLALFNDHLDHLVGLKSVNLIKMLNLFNSIKVFNLITFLGQAGRPWRCGGLGQVCVGVTWLLATK